jgi:hypothetical protein
VFFNSNNTNFRVYYGSAGPLKYDSTNVRNSSPGQTQVTRETYKPGFIERWFTKAMLKIGGFVMRRLLGLQYSPVPDNLDQYQDLEVSRNEAADGGEKELVFQRDEKTRRLMVKIPTGIQAGTQIRSKAWGEKTEKHGGPLLGKVKLV